MSHPCTERDRIERLHREMLNALRVDYFPPGMSDAEAWRGFLYVMDTLAETPGGMLTPRDVRNAVDLMRKQVAEKKAGWSLRFSKIIRDPEAFRDLVLETRRKIRPRPEVREEAVTRPGIGTRLELVDPVASQDSIKSIKKHAEEFFAQFGVKRPSEKEDHAD